MEEISIKKAALINFASKYTIVIIQLLYNSVLARILMPDEFGVVAILNVFISFFVLLADMGLGNAVIQNQELDDDDISSIFIISVILSIVLSGIFILLSYPISQLYNNPEYMIMCPLLSIAILFNSLNTIPAALLMKKQKFKTVAIRQIIINISCSILTIFLAVKGMKYYSLIAYTISAAILNFVWNYFSCNFKFKFIFKKESFNKIKEFSLFLMSFNIINYLSKNIDRLIIGKVSGNTDVGNYNKAYQLTTYPLNYLTFVITPVLLPVLSAHQTNKEFIYNKYLKLVKLLSLMGIYVSIMCFFCSDEVTTIFYGSNWGIAAICFKWLSLSIWAQMINSSASVIFQILNNNKLQFKSAIYMLLLMIIFIVIGGKLGGIKGISIFIMIANNIQFIILTYFLIKLSFGFSILSYLKIFIPDLICAVILFVSLQIISLFYIPNIFLSVILKLIISVIVFYFALSITRQLNVFIEILPKKLSERFK